MHECPCPDLSDLLMAINTLTDELRQLRLALPSQDIEGLVALHERPHIERLNHKSEEPLHA